MQALNAKFVFFVSKLNLKTNIKNTDKVDIAQAMKLRQVIIGTEYQQTTVIM